MIAETSIADLRREYTLHGLRRADLASDPIQQFKSWLEEAIAAGSPEPTAMTLATANAKGIPSARIVLLKAVDSRGFSFFTNYKSDKAQDLMENPRASLVFHWIGLERQVTVRGTVEKLGREESAKYFESRPRASQVGAWASPQSAIVEDREILEWRFAEAEARFESEEVPLPPHWGGFVVRPLYVEFWQGRPSRLHDRLRYHRDAEGWTIERLSP